ncbi:MAG TPA: hypothetical protein VF742_15665, partial [Terracidiphilus sp.]
MKHLSEEELIELYYGEAAHPVSAHLEACRECTAQYVELKQSLDAMRPAAAPQPSAQYGERVWKALKPQLIPYEKKARGWRGWSQWRAATL